MSNKSAQFVLGCLVWIAFAVAHAAEAVVPPAPPKPAPAVKHKPYQAAVQNDVSAAYEYRTRILAGKPACQRFATESDAAFLDARMDGEAKVALLKRIGTEAAATGCLAQ